MSKKNFVIAIVAGMALAGSSCSSGNDQNQPKQEDTVSIAPEDQPAEEVDAPFSYKSDSIERKFKNSATSKISADFAKDGNKNLVKNINTYINDELGGKYKKEIEDTKDVLAFYANLQLDQMKEDLTDNIEYVYERRVLFNHETENYISYTSFLYTYTGGAHGASNSDGATFRKSDGVQLTWDMFDDLKGNEFKQILKEGIKSYLEKGLEKKIKNDNEYKEYLLNVSDVNNLPLPSSNPYFSKKGLVIHYTQYEIAPYACGQPEFVVPFATARKFLKEPGFLF
ncbi:MAG: DUF3298 domain-containing protein [Paludibacteraceae bacterium]|nr:DUF3298 domain-containing protein [Paludibacteraceae bacterium]